MPRVAAVQLEASHLDPAAGSRRIEEWAREAAAEDAEDIVLPELLVPSYPRYVPDPFPPTAEGTEAWEEAGRYHRAYVDGSQDIPGPPLRDLRDQRPRRAPGPCRSLGGDRRRAHQYSAPRAISMRIDTERPKLWGDS